MRVARWWTAVALAVVLPSCLPAFMLPMPSSAGTRRFSLVRERGHLKVCSAPTGLHLQMEGLGGGRGGGLGGVRRVGEEREEWERRQEWGFARGHENQGTQSRLHEVEAAGAMSRDGVGKDEDQGGEQLIAPPRERRSMDANARWQNLFPHFPLNLDSLEEHAGTDS